ICQYVHQRNIAMGAKVPTAAVAIAFGMVVVAVFVQSPTNSNAQNKTCYPPKYTDAGDLLLPENWHDWIFVGSPLTPNALNNGKAMFPEYHNVYIEPCSYETYKMTNSFPDGTIFLGSSTSHANTKIPTHHDPNLQEEAIF